MRKASALLALLLGLVLGASDAVAQKAGDPGRFDYYVLALSWSPTWCGSKAGRKDTEQCAGPRRHGFVVHGLWPQYAKGGYPAECAAASKPLPVDLVEDMLPVMPSRALIQHQWRRHGTCEGADPRTYFNKTRAALAKVTIPEKLRAPVGPLVLPVAEVERQFASSNPGLGADSIAIVCRRDRLAEVRICLDRKLGFRPCGPDVADRCKGDATFPSHL